MEGGEEGESPQIDLGQVDFNFAGLELDLGSGEKAKGAGATATPEDAPQKLYELQPLAQLEVLDFGGDNADGDGDDDEGDEPEGSEPDDDDDSDAASHKRAKVINPFLDLEVEVDDDEDDELVEAEEGYNDLVVDDDVVAAERSERRANASFWAFDEENQEFDEEAINKRYEKISYADYEQVMGNEMLPDEGLLPGITDPKLFMVKCKPGKEREVVISIQTRHFTRREAGQSLPIFGVTAPKHTKGFIFVEAHKELDVRNAIRGIRHAFSTKCQLVPLKQMPDVLRASDQNSGLAVGSWVRPSRSDDPNSGDLGRVFKLINSGAAAEIMLIPRIDLEPEKIVDEEPADELYDEDDEQVEVGADGQRKRKKKKVKRKRKPPKMGKAFRAVLFNPDAVVKRYGHDSVKERHEDGKRYYYFDNKKFGLDGYYYKTMNLRSLRTVDVEPTLEELQQFTEGLGADESGGTAENKLLSLSKLANIRSKPVQFLKGDMVKVIAGSEKNLVGEVVSANSGLVTVRLKGLGMDLRESFKPTELVKHFNVGEHVKVIGGSFKGETGMISNMLDNLVFLVRDSDFSQLKVLRPDIQKTTEVASGRTHLGQFRLHDLVRLGQRNVGVIVKIGTSSFQVLDQSNNVHTVDQAGLQAKVSTRDPFSFDKNQARVGPGDLLRVMTGRHKGEQGEVKHIYRFFTWLQSRTHMENGGMLAVKTNECAVAGGSSASSARRGSRSVGGAGMPLQSPGKFGNQNQPITRNTPSMGRNKRNDEMMHQTVKIVRGKYKSRVATVQDVLDGRLRVMLQANQRVVTVLRADAKLMDQLHAPRMGKAAERGWERPGQGAPATPAYDALRPQTPATPSRHMTPLRGDQDSIWSIPTQEELQEEDEAGGWEESESAHAELSLLGTTPDWMGGSSMDAMSSASSSLAPTPTDVIGHSSMYASAPYQQQPPMQYQQQPIQHQPIYQPDMGAHQPEVAMLQRSVEVKVLSGDYAGRVGGIEFVSHTDHQITIQFAGGQQTVVRADQIVPTQPSAGDRIVMLGGELIGNRGKLSSIDHNQEALVEFDTLAVDVVPVAMCGKLWENV